MIEMPVVFAMDLSLAGGDGEIPLPCTMKYNTNEPLEVVFVFHTARTDNQWVFSRDILINGLSGEAGEGDVRAWRDGPIFHMIFKAHPHQAKVWCETEVIQDFIEAVLIEVPFGEETIDFDRELKSLLEG